MKSRFDSLDHWIEALVNEDIPIIVEGPNDRKALEALGITQIVTLGKDPLYKVAEDLAKRTKRVIILTDFDKKGKFLYGRLKRSFERIGVQVDRSFREYLFTETSLAHMEGLFTYVKNHPPGKRPLRKKP